jgi:hypothetical protein
VPHLSTDFDAVLESLDEGLAILIANEDTHAAKGMAAHLRQSGHQVRVVPDGQSALSAA